MGLFKRNSRAVDAAANAPAEGTPPPHDRQKRQGRRRKTKRPGRGALLILATFLLGSATLRLGETWGTAIALEGAADPVAETETPEQVPEFEAILAALDAREARISEREAALDTRAQAMALAEKRVDEKLAELKAAEEELRATIAVAQTASENDLAQLTSVYENMGSDEAAALFSQMNPDFAAGFMARMRPDSAAAILAGLEPNIAYEISVILAGRNARVPTE